MLAAILVAALASSGAHTSLSISPWTGPDVPTAIASAAAKARLTISGRPGATIRLTAKKVADGWLPAFCTPKVCAPVKVTVVLPKSGVLAIQFELVRETADAPRASSATIVSNDGASVVMPTATR